jgi:hypothetical protein
MNEENSVVPKLLGVTAIFVAVMAVLGYLATMFPGFADGATRLTSSFSAVERPVTTTEPQIYRCRMTKEFELDKTGSQVRTTHVLTACGNENSK